MKISFCKYEGAGNNFIAIDMTSTEYDITPQHIQKLCQRNTGIGADGVMVLKKSLLPECRYKYIHYVPITGKEGLLCGNGIRCSLAFAEQMGLIRLQEGGGSPIFFEACDGVHAGGKLSWEKYFVSVKDVSLKNVSLHEDKHYYFLDVGHRHCVRFVEDIRGKEVSSEGLEFRHTSNCCVDFVQVVDKGDTSSLAIRAYENGFVEETQACGTGAVASAIVAFFRQRYSQNPDGGKDGAELPVTTRVSMQGGELEVEFRVRGHRVTDIRLSGPVRHVFDGVVIL